MRNFTISNYQYPRSGSYRHLIKGLLLFMAMVLFQFTQAYAQLVKQHSNNQETPATQVTHEIQSSPNIVYINDGEAIDSNSAEYKAMMKNLALTPKSNTAPLTNPDLPENISCTDLRVVFVLDESGSILVRNAVDQVREAVLGLAESLQGSSATLKIIEFNSLARVIDLGESSVNANYIANLTDYLYDEYNGESYDPVLRDPADQCPKNFTNWQDALEKIQPPGEFVPPSLVIFLTDGEPTAKNASNTCGFQTGGGLDEAIIAANTLKANGAHMFAIGVGDAIDVPNLQLISGDSEFGTDGSIFTDDYSTGSFEDLKANLKAGLTSICGTELEITKTVDIEEVCAEDQTVIFTLTVENLGGENNIDAANVVVADEFLSAFTSLTILAPVPVGAAIDGQILTYNVGTLAPGESKTIQIQATLSGADGSYANIATADASNADMVQDDATVEKGGEFTDTLSITACGSFTIHPSDYVLNPVDSNDETLTAAGSPHVRIITGETAAGCLKIVTLNITVNERIATEPEIVSSCGTYDWDVNDDGEFDPETEPSYSTGGTYTAELTNDEGLCVLATLILTVTPATIFDGIETSCDGPVVLTIDGGDGNEYEIASYSTSGPKHEEINLGDFCILIDIYVNIGNPGDLCDADGDPATIDDGTMVIDPITGKCVCLGTPPPTCVSPDLSLAISADEAGQESVGNCLDADGIFWVQTNINGGSGNVTGYNVLVNGILSQVAAEGTFAFGPFNQGTDVTVSITGIDHEECGAEGSIASPEVCPPTDCNGDVNGTAYYDNCNTCVEGNTGLEACVQDCHGDWGGTASIDDCGVCSGGNTGLIPNESCTGCDADAGSITFSDDSIEKTICADDGDPSLLSFTITEPWNTGGLWTRGIVTDASGNVLYVTDSQAEIQSYDFDQFGIGTFYLYVLNFDHNHSNYEALYDSFLNGDVVNIGDITGCFDLSDPLTVIGDDSPSGEETRVECGSFEWNGQPITESGTYTHVFDGLNGKCDSTATLYATITDCGSTECTDFKYFYIASNSPGVTNGTVFNVDLSGSDATLTELFQTGYDDGHIAVNEEDELIYVISGTGSEISTYNMAGDWQTTVAISGLNRTVAMAYDPTHPGTVLVGSQTQKKVYRLDPLTGLYSVVVTNAPVWGGDIFFIGNESFLVQRINNTHSIVYNITGGTAVPLANTIAAAVNGASATASNGFVVASGNMSTSFYTYDADGSNRVEYTAMLDGEVFFIADGDMAGGCFGDIPVIDDCDYVMFLASDQNSGIGGTTEIYSMTINPDKTTNNTLLTTVDFPCHGLAYSPEGVEGSLYLIETVQGRSSYIVWDIHTNAPVAGPINMVTSAGHNIPNVPAGAYKDGVLYVASYNHNKVYMINPATGIAFASISTNVNGGDLMFDEHGDLWYLERYTATFTNLTGGGSFNIPSLSNIHGVTLMPNGNFMVANGAGESVFYEVDPAAHALVPGSLYDTGIDQLWGDLAAVNCFGGEGVPPGLVESDNFKTDLVVKTNAVLSSYPNPTTGTSKVSFTVPSTETTTLEVYDMNGRSVATIFNGIAEKDQAYTIDFNGTNLPNGVYIYRLTTTDSTIIDKFMIAR